MTAKQITIDLWLKLRTNSQVMIPRYTPRDWWECDLWRWTKGDATEEYEIKLSLGDFKADFKKAKRGRITFKPEGGWVETPGTMKHEQLATSNIGPNRFYYVMPYELAAKIDLPPYAGLWVVKDRYLYKDKKAPNRHEGKCNIPPIRLLQTMYHRYWHHEYGKKTDFATTDAG